MPGGLLYANGEARTGLPGGGGCRYNGFPMRG